MNRPPEQFKRLDAAHLRDFAARCLKAAGLCADHAEQLAQLLTNSDLRGVCSHGTRALGGYCNSLRQGYINPNPNVAVLQETDVMVQVDGDGGLGYAPMMLATEMAVTKAKEKGMAAAAAVHIGHYGSAGHYVRRAMQDGCTAFSVQGSHPDYFGEGGGNKGQQAAYWGNPPLCFGLPSQDEPPFVHDVATCIMADYQRGEEYDALQEMIPAAFFKSMGYTGVGIALGGPFVGTNNARARDVTARWSGVRQGGLIVVMDIGLFAPPEEFRTGVDNLVRGVRETMIPVRGYDEATLPGTIEYRKEREYGRDGVPVGLEDVENLEDVGRIFGVTPPWR